jgi:hypothetical protein
MPLTAGVFPSPLHARLVRQKRRMINNPPYRRSAASFQKTDDTPSTFACFTFSGRRFAFSTQGGRLAHKGAMGL